MRQDLNGRDTKYSQCGSGVLLESQAATLTLIFSQEDDADDGGEREEDVDETHRVDYAGGEVAQVASQEIALQRYRRVVGTTVHQVADEQSVENEEHEILHPLLAGEHEGKHQQQGCEYRIDIHLDLGERCEGGLQAPDDVEEDELQEGASP